MNKQGLRSLWAGNTYLIKLCIAQSICKLSAHDRIKYALLKNKYNHILASVLGITSSALLTGIISYPFDLAYARISGSIRAISTYTNSAVESNWKILMYYEAFLYALAENTLNGAIILATYYSIRNSFSTLNIFAASSIAAAFSSVLTYPFNTLKRHAQVAKFGGDFKNLTFEIKDLTKNLRPFYK